MQLANKRNLIIAGVVVLLLIVIGGLFALQQARNQSTNTDSAGTETQTVDKNSGETVTTFEGKTPETYGVLPDAPMYLGITQFLDVGITTEQLDNIKYALYQYAISTTPKIKQVSITENSAIAQTPNAEGKATMTFEVVMDKQPKMKGSVVYLGDTIELTLTDSTGKKVFESGPVTGKSMTIDPS